MIKVSEWIKKKDGFYLYLSYDNKKMLFSHIADLSCFSDGYKMKSIKKYKSKIYDINNIFRSLDQDYFLNPIMHFEDSSLENIKIKTKNNALKIKTEMEYNMNKIQSSLKLKSALNNLYAVLSRSDNDAQVKRAIGLISEVKKELDIELNKLRSGGDNG